MLKKKLSHTYLCMYYCRTKMTQEQLANHYSNTTQELKRNNYFFSLTKYLPLHVYNTHLRSHKTSIIYTTETNNYNYLLHVIINNYLLTSNNYLISENVLFLNKQALFKRKSRQKVQKETCQHII